MYSVCFSCKLRAVDTNRGYVGRYEERLARQESGAALSKSSMYLSGQLLYGVH